MRSTIFALFSSVYLYAASSLAYADCSPVLTASIVSAERIIDSLRPDKPGQMRVFASDDSEFNGGDALWMKGQLRFIQRACGQSEEAAAAAHLKEVQDVLKAHHPVP